MKRFIDSCDADQVRRLDAENVPRRQIAKRVGISRDSVQAILGRDRNKDWKPEGPPGVFGSGWKQGRCRCHGARGYVTSAGLCLAGQQAEDRETIRLLERNGHA